MNANAPLNVGVAVEHPDGGTSYYTAHTDAATLTHAAVIGRRGADPEAVKLTLTHTRNPKIWATAHIVGRAVHVTGVAALRDSDRAANLIRRFYDTLRANLQEH